MDWYWISFYLLLSLFIFVCLVMMLLVLIQKGRGGGLASAFGGGGGNTAFGSKTGDVLTWATSIVFGVFLLLAIVLNIMTRKHHEAELAAQMQMQATDNPIQTPGMPAPEGTPLAAPTTNPAGK
jgi:preprotein translocase subunit SecG